MKAKIHPQYVDATFTCACGNSWQTRATKAQVRLDVCSKWHPYFTGNQRPMAVACRRPGGESAVRHEGLGSVYTGALRRIPFVRGVIILGETLALGMRSLVFSSNVALGEEEKEISPTAIIGMGLTALALVTVVFFLGPLFV